MNMDLNQEQIELSLPSTSTALSQTFVDCSTQCSLVRPKNLSCIKLRRQVKTLKQKVRRRDLKISNMTDVINEIKQNGYSNENLDVVLRNYFEG